MHYIYSGYPTYRASEHEPGPSEHEPGPIANVMTIADRGALAGYVGKYGQALVLHTLSEIARHAAELKA